MRLDRTLPATLLFNYPTLAELAEHLGEELGLSATEPAVATVAAEATRRDLDDKSEGELAELLEQKLNGMAALTP